MRIILRSLLAALFLAPAVAFPGDRLIVTGGAQQIEGAAGGGLVPWALIAGYGTREQAGGSVFVTRLHTQDFRVEGYGVALGLFDRIELSAARQSFDAGSVVPGLNLRMETLGAKVRVFGDALYEQDSPWPQLALGMQRKKNRGMEVPATIGATRDSDTDFYLAATKVWLAGAAGRNLLGNLTLRATRANQLGFLGFGGEREDSRRLQAEASLALLINDRLVLGAEYRGKPDNLSAFREDDFADVFVAWFPNKHAAVTLAWARLGSVAGKTGQSGAYLSLQLTL